MEEESSDELLRRQRHDSGSVAVAPLAPPQPHLPIPHGHESVIAERHAMRIAPQIREDVLCRGKRRLGIDDPGLLPQWREETLEGPGVPQGGCGPRPLEAVLRGIDNAFDKYDVRAFRSPGRMRKVNGLAWCAQSVMEAGLLLPGRGNAQP